MVGKRKLALILSATLLGVSLIGCSGNDTSSKSNEVKKIGILQLIQHDALDSANKGFIDGLKEKGYEEGKNISIEQQNAQGEIANTQTIANQFVDSKKDLIFAIATPSAQATYNVTKDIPIVFTAVTDPVSAEIAKDLKNSGNNVTGTSDKVSANKQLELLKKLLPDSKRIGVIYNTSETNSVVQVSELKDETSKVGLEVKEIGVTNVNEISQNLTSAMSSIDVLYTPTDNTVASGADLIIQTCLSNNIPIIGADEAITKKGGFASVGIDYYKLGKETALKAAEILEGKSPSDIEITTLSDMSYTINTDIAKKLNIAIPEEIEATATKVTGGVK